MGKKATIAGVSFSIIGLIAVIAYFVNVQPVLDERVKVANEKLQESINDLDRIVNRAIVHCSEDNPGCDELMLQWAEECKNPELKDVPSCHDGRIDSYLTKRYLVAIKTPEKEVNDQKNQK